MLKNKKFKILALYITIMLSAKAFYAYGKNELSTNIKYNTDFKNELNAQQIRTEKAKILLKYRELELEKNKNKLEKESSKLKKLKKQERSCEIDYEGIKYGITKEEKKKLDKKLKDLKSKLKEEKNKNLALENEIKSKEYYFSPLHQIENKANNIKYDFKDNPQGSVLRKNVEINFPLFYANKDSDLPLTLEERRVDKSYPNGPDYRETEDLRQEILNTGKEYFNIVLPKDDNSEPILDNNNKIADEKIRLELANYAATLINSAREKKGLGPVEVTEKSMELTRENIDRWNDANMQRFPENGASTLEDVHVLFSNNDLYNKGLISESQNMGLVNRDDNGNLKIDEISTYFKLKAKIYTDNYGMMYADGIEYFGHRKTILLPDKYTNSSTGEVNNNTKLVMGFGVNSLGNRIYDFFYVNKDDNSPNLYVNTAQTGLYKLINTKNNDLEFSKNKIESITNQINVINAKNKLPLIVAYKKEAIINCKKSIENDIQSSIRHINNIKSKIKILKLEKDKASVHYVNEQNKLQDKQKR